MCGMKIPKDKLLHFAGCLIGALVSIPFVLGGALYVEAKDFYTYGLTELKSKDSTRIRSYIKNTIGDLIADVIGILIGGLIWLI